MFAVKRPTSPNTTYYLTSEGNVALIRQRNLSSTSDNLFAGPIVPYLDNTYVKGTITEDGIHTYVGLSEGTVDLTAANNDKAVLTNGYTAQMGKDGIRIYQSAPTYDRVNLIGDRAKFSSDPSNRIIVNGVEVESGQVVWHPRHIRIETSDGSFSEKNLKQEWPKR